MMRRMLFARTLSTFPSPNRASKYFLIKPGRFLKYSLAGVGIFYVCDNLRELYYERDLLKPIQYPSVTCNLMFSCLP